MSVLLTYIYDCGYNNYTEEVKMLKKILFCFIPFFIINIITAEEHSFRDYFDLGFNSGSFGGGMSFLRNDHNFELSTTLINIFIEHKTTKLGIEYNPVKYWGFFSSKNQAWDQNFYLMNLNIYFNPYTIIDSIFGPFVSINYFDVNNWSGFKLDKYIFSAGLRLFSMAHLERWQIPLQILGGEMGYRNNSGNHAFYFNINIDIVVIAGIIAMGVSGNATREVYDEYERQINGPSIFIPKDPKVPNKWDRFK
jgi:hypothetical protein